MRPGRPHHRSRWVLTVDERAALVVGHSLLQRLAKPDGLQQLVPGLQWVATLLARASTKRWRWWRRWARQSCCRWRRRRWRERHSGLHPCRKNRQKSRQCQVSRSGPLRRSGHHSSLGPTERGRGVARSGRVCNVLATRRGPPSMTE